MDPTNKTLVIALQPPIREQNRGMDGPAQDDFNDGGEDSPDAPLGSEVELPEGVSIPAGTRDGDTLAMRTEFRFTDVARRCGYFIEVDGQAVPGREREERDEDDAEAASGMDDGDEPPAVRPAPGFKQLMARKFRR